MGFWDFIWLMFSFVMFTAYLILLFLVIRDISRTACGRGG